jgi:hypothetical protein
MGTHHRTRRHLHPPHRLKRLVQNQLQGFSQFQATLQSFGETYSSTVDLKRLSHVCLKSVIPWRGYIRVHGSHLSWKLIASLCL